MNIERDDARLIELYDTTLRDGAQTAGVHFSLADKIGIIEMLDDFGIDIIEAGWNGANVTDTRLFDHLQRHAPRNSRIAAFCSTHHPARAPQSDPVFLAGTAAEVPVMTLFGKTWDFQVKEALQVSLERNLEIIHDSLSHCRPRFDDLVFDAEHFFDGLKANPDYACRVIETALQAGADCIVLCDTNGGMLPRQIGRALDLLRQRFPGARFGIHGHNDSDTAVANSLAALEHGAVQVQGTINGIGERCGNTNLCSLIPTLAIKYGYRTRFIDQDRLPQLRRLSGRVAEVLRVPVPANQPYVGENAFAHKAGVHIASVLKHPGCYEHVDPERVGHSRRLVISDQSGRVAVGHKIRELGYEAHCEQTLSRLVEEIKRRSSQGYAFDKAELSLELLIHEHLGAADLDLALEHLACEPLPTLAGRRSYRVELAVSLGGRVRFRRAFGEDPVATFESLLLGLVREQVPEFLPLPIRQTAVEVLDETRKRAWVTAQHEQGPPRRSMAVTEACEVQALCLAITECYRWALLNPAAAPQAQNRACLA